MKTCEKCGTANEPDVVFCVNCGSKLAASGVASINHPGNHHAAKVGMSKANEHLDIPHQPHPAAAQRKAAEQVFCESCGTANETGVRFCVNCGSNLSNDSAAPQSQPVRQYSNAQQPYGNFQQPYDVEPVQYAPNPLELMWRDMLFPEKMIIVGAILNCLLAIFWIFAGSLLSPMLAFFYFVTMGGSLVLAYLSRGVSLLKKMELSSWHVAIGAFWLSWLFDVVFRTNGYYYNGTSALLIFNVICSIVMLSGAIMLQGVLIRSALQQRSK